MVMTRENRGGSRSGNLSRRHMYTAAKKERRAKDEKTDAETPDPPPTISFLARFPDR